MPRKLGEVGKSLGIAAGWVRAKLNGRWLPAQTNRCEGPSSDSACWERHGQAGRIGAAGEWQPYRASDTRLMSRGTHNGRGPRSGETRRGLRPRRLGRGIVTLAANAGLYALTDLHRG